MNKDAGAALAPDWQVSQWLNTKVALDLAVLRGRVVVLHAFQMLCPGCVNHGLPQAERIHRQFDSSDVAVIGMHTVFEHHSVMTPEALRVFLHECRITHPIAVDRAIAGDPIPATMRAYQMQGTPTLVLIDRQGRRRFQQFGRVEDLAAGAELMSLVRE
jgi:hypothetical protein